MTADPARLKEKIRAAFLAAGFDAVRFASPAPPPKSDALDPWLDAGHHGEMAWMAREPEKRRDPRKLVPGTGTVIVAGTNYQPKGDPLDYLEDPAAMGISAYARNKPYQELLKKRLKKLYPVMEELAGRALPGARGFADTAPVMEKPLAAAAGLGWQGKNALLVSRRFGCWLFLAELFLPLALPPDPPSKDHCGTCDRCIKACPTDALDPAHPYQMKAERCLAYLTIEHPGPIPHRYRAALGNRVFGCDDCLAACPFNRFGPPTDDPWFLPREALTAPKLADFAYLDDAAFREIFQKSAIKRSGLARFHRNLAVALGNWGSEAAAEPLRALAASPHALVRSHAAWGLGRLPGGFALLNELFRAESDPAVRDEVAQVLAEPRSSD